MTPGASTTVYARSVGPHRNRKVPTLYHFYPSPPSGAMAGLGVFFHESALALAPRGLPQSAYDFLCLIYITKSPRAS
jgi:hypothetical protein